MLGIIIVALLYADDAALPADNPEDLQASAMLFEHFCNAPRLFISLPKTFITVFHDVSDEGVQYQDGKVLVDGTEVSIKIYNSSVAAVPVFKYLGVIFNELVRAGRRPFGIQVGGLSTGSAHAHFWSSSSTSFIFSPRCVIRACEFVTTVKPVPLIIRKAEPSLGHALRADPCYAGSPSTRFAIMFN